jgi:hypothetical protein
MNSGEIGHEDACALALFLARTNAQAITRVRLLELNENQIAADSPGGSRTRSRPGY